MITVYTIQSVIALFFSSIHPSFSKQLFAFYNNHWSCRGMDVGSSKTAKIKELRPSETLTKA